MSQKLHSDHLHAAIIDYLDGYCVEKNMSPVTVRSKRELLIRLEKFLNGRPYELSTVREFLAYLYNNGWDSPNSRLDLVRILRAFTNVLEKRGYLEKSFATEIIKPKVPQKEFEYIKPETVEKIIVAGTEPTPPGVKGDNSINRARKQETRDALRTIIRTGLRISEITKLRGSDIRIEDDPSSYVVSSKGGDRDILPIPADLIEMFAKRQSRDRVFPVTKKLCNTALKRGCQRLGIKQKLTCHSLRHIFATALRKRGIDTADIQRLLRHESIETTNRMYLHQDIKDLSLIVNQQPLVRAGLKTQEVLQELEKAIKKTGIEDDIRFDISWSHSENELLFKAVVANRELREVAVS